jgi:hypothetical protein
MHHFPTYTDDNFVFLRSRAVDLVNDNVPEKRVTRELERKLGSEYNTWTVDYTIHNLYEMDIRNKSWMSEDPTGGNIQTYAYVA